MGGAVDVTLVSVMRKTQEQQRASSTKPSDASRLRQRNNRHRSAAEGSHSQAKIPGPIPSGGNHLSYEYFPFLSLFSMT